MAHQQFIDRPSCGLICKGAETKFLKIPCPIPKKSPSGTSTLGEFSPSHHARRTMLRKKWSPPPPTVIQMCRMQPGFSLAMITRDCPGSKTHQSLLLPAGSKLDARQER